MDLLPKLLNGLAFTILITLLSCVTAFVVSMILGLARLSSWRAIRVAATAFVEVFRGSSALVQIFFWFFILPLVGITLGPIKTSVIALGINGGAYGSEVVRAGILAVDRGQREAATAINMPYWLTMQRIILPQAFLTMLPPFGNLAIELMKSTSLVSFIGLTELTFAGRQILQTEGIARREETYLISLLLYFALAYPITRTIRGFERRLSRGLQVGSL